MIMPVQFLWNNQSNDNSSSSFLAVLFSCSAIWRQLDKSLKLFTSSSGLLKQEIIFRSGTKKKKCFSFGGVGGGGERGKKFWLIRIIYKAFFWAKGKTGENQKKLKHFVVASSKWTVLFLIYVDLTFNRKVKQIFEIKLFIFFWISTGKENVFVSG